MQVAVPRGSVGHAEQLAPHEFTLLFETQLPPQLWNPPLQPVSEQVPAAVLQAPVPLGKSVVQLTRPDPQVKSVFCSHPPLKAWNPVLQVTVQAPACASQVEVEFAIRVQSTGGEPHEVSVLAAHELLALSTWNHAAQVVTVHEPFGVEALMVQPPEPLANVVVQFLQPGPGPQHVDELTSQAVPPNPAMISKSSCRPINAGTASPRSSTKPDAETSEEFVLADMQLLASHFKTAWRRSAAA